ncbi:MAG: esterase family protein [Verrucomicrobia bacterium]|nr:MAG: esterase family protein [Verrucomicrobiota bacterium]
MTRFRTVEVSDPRFEHEGLRWLTVRGRGLAGRGDITVHVPPEVEGRHGVPLVVLMHGVYGSHWGWAFKGGAHRIAAAMIRSGEIPPMVLAMPSDGLPGDGSGYVRQSRADYEEWIVGDVPAAVRHATAAVGDGSAVFLAGLSMGGFGALRLGARHPDRFRAVSGLSSATHLDQLCGFMAEAPGWEGAGVEDPGVLEAMLRAKRLPGIRFDCGTEDPLLEGNRALHRGLEAAGIAHEYVEHPGGHTWEYWERHLPETLRFFAARS